MPFKLYKHIENKNLNLALHNANDRDFQRKLINKIYELDFFDMSTADPPYIAKTMDKVLKENIIWIKIYYPKWRWSKAIGYYSNAKPFDINLNGYKLNRSTGSFIQTFYHELIHLCDHLDSRFSYGHGSNNAQGKEYTAPYKIGEMAQDLYDGKQSSDHIESYVNKSLPWYKRLWQWIF